MPSLEYMAFFVSLPANVSDALLLWIRLNDNCRNDVQRLEQEKQQLLDKQTALEKMQLDMETAEAASKNKRVEQQDLT